MVKWVLIAGAFVAVGVWSAGVAQARDRDHRDRRGHDRGKQHQGRSLDRGGSHFNFGLTLGSGHHLRLRADHLRSHLWQRDRGHFRSQFRSYAPQHHYYPQTYSPRLYPRTFYYTPRYHSYPRAYYGGICR